MKLPIKRLFLISLVVGTPFCKAMNNNNNQLAVRYERGRVIAARRAHVHDRGQLQDVHHLKAKKYHEEKVEEGIGTSIGLFFIGVTTFAVSNYIPSGFIKEWVSVFSYSSVLSSAVFAVGTIDTKQKGFPDDRKTVGELQQEAAMIHSLPEDEG